MIIVLISLFQRGFITALTAHLIQHYCITHCGYVPCLFFGVFFYYYYFIKISVFLAIAQGMY
jgi:hypothetical protein